MARASKGAAKLPDALRRAVDRTFQSTVGSATITRERAQEIVDDVLHRAEESAARAGRGVGRGVREAGHKQRDAAAGMGDRVRGLIGELGGGGEEIEQLRGEVTRLKARVDELERKLSTRRSQVRRSGSRAGAASARKPAQGRSRKKK
jgi:polyhydroxyalkanoate synthesis regulator phasin